MATQEKNYKGVWTHGPLEASLQEVFKWRQKRHTLENNLCNDLQKKKKKNWNPAEFPT